MDAGYSGGFFEAGGVDGAVGYGDVTGYGFGEDDAFLHDDAAPAAPLAEVHRGEVFGSDGDGAFLWAVIAEEELDEGGFAAAGGADDGGDFAGGDGEGDVAECDPRAVGIVAEGEVFDGNGGGGEVCFLGGERWQ